MTIYSEVTKNSYSTSNLNLIILLGILPDSPPDSGSEQCHLSPPGHGHPDMTTVTLYNDPVLYQGG